MLTVSICNKVLNRYKLPLVVSEVDYPFNLICWIKFEHEKKLFYMLIDIPLAFYEFYIKRDDRYPLAINYCGYIWDRPRHEIETFEGAIEYLVKAKRIDTLLYTVNHNEELLKRGIKSKEGEMLW
jgi:hypothetical protein